MGGDGGGAGNGDEDEENLMLEEVDNSLHIKGQMMLMPDWNLILFLGAPILADLSTLEKSGLYVSDLPMHDFSRDLLLAADQKSDTMKEALENEQANIPNHLPFSDQLLAIELHLTHVHTL